MIDKIDVMHVAYATVWKKASWKQRLLHPKLVHREALIRVMHAVHRYEMSMVNDKRKELAKPPLRLSVITSRRKWL